MATTVMATVQKNSKLALAIGLAFTCLPSHAGEWDFDPKITLDETFTDNVSLESTDKESSLVSQLGVLIDNEYKAKNAELEFSLHSQYAMYSHDSDLNKDYHTFEGSGRLELWPNGIALIGNASVRNQSRNSRDNSLADIVSADTTQVQNYNGGLQYTLSNRIFQVNALAGYNTTISEDNIGEQDGFTFALLSENGKQNQYLFWDLSANFQKIENNNQEGEMHSVEVKLGMQTPYKFTPFVRLYDENNDGNINQGNRDLQSNSYGVGFRWLPLPRLLLDLSYNKPESGSKDLEGNSLEDYVDAKIRWQPTKRTTLEAGFSQRFYGDSYNFALQHKNKRLTNSIKYDERVLAFTRDRYLPESQGVFLCPIDALTPSDCFINNDQVITPGDYEYRELFNFNIVEDNVFSLNKTIEWSSILELPRTTLSLTLRGNNRESLENGEEDQFINANFRVSRKVSGYSDATFSAMYQQQDYGVDTENERNDEYLKFSAEYVRKLNSTLNATFGISHLDRDSSEQRYSYKEGRVYLQVKKGF